MLGFRAQTMEQERICHLSRLGENVSSTLSVWNADASSDISLTHPPKNTVSG